MSTTRVLIRLIALNDTNTTIREALLDALFAVRRLSLEWEPS